jgi:hypothetical protein
MLASAKDGGIVGAQPSLRFGWRADEGWRLPTAWWPLRLARTGRTFPKYFN